MQRQVEPHLAKPKDPNLFGQFRLAKFFFLNEARAGLINSKGRNSPPPCIRNRIGKFPARQNFSRTYEKRLVSCNYIQKQTFICIDELSPGECTLIVE